MSAFRNVLQRFLLTIAFVAFSASAAEPEATEKDRRLLAAILAEDTAGFERALDDGANVNSSVGKWEDEWAMCAATQPGKEHFLRALLGNGADPDLMNPQHSAVELPSVCSMVNGNLAAFDILIEAGADPNLIGPNQRSLYLSALLFGNFDIGLRLLEITEPSYGDMLYTRKIIERTTTLQGPETRALAAHVEARGIPVSLPPARR